MSKSRGKKFEENFRECLKKCKDISIDRLKDTMDGFKGNSNVCDFIVYSKPNQFYLELKSVQGKYFSFGNLTNNQYTGLLDKAKIPGVIAGVIIWYVDYDITVFVPITEIQKAREENYNSINLNNMNKFKTLTLTGKKKRVFWEYDVKSFLERLKVWN